MGVEVSRLARNSADWHRLIELCALTTTLILDEDGVYDPASFNDRLLLGLKGTMSEAELHILRARKLAIPTGRQSERRRAPTRPGGTRPGAEGPSLQRRCSEASRPMPDRSHGLRPRAGCG
jgi:DNA invertase Pin-like site-specific DNA recombinase